MKTIKECMFEVCSVKILEKSDQEKIKLRDDKIKYFDSNGNEFYSLADAKEFFKNKKMDGDL